MTYSKMNFSGIKRSTLSGLGIENGDVFEDCNFAQYVTGFDLFSGRSGLTFRRCNLVNVEVPWGSIIEDCLVLTKSFCKNLHPDKTDVPSCVENCSHVVDTDVVMIDGQVVDTIYHYEDTVVT